MKDPKMFPDQIGHKSCFLSLKRYHTTIIQIITWEAGKGKLCILHREKHFCSQPYGAEA